ncbi:MAG: hypothetical protein RIC55_00175 [Pirellulaceae bacterium]
MSLSISDRRRLFHIFHIFCEGPSLFQYLGEQTDPRGVGTIEINTEYHARRKPLWLVILKLVGLAVMLPVGFVLVVPLIPLPMWQALVVSSGVLMIYVGLAFFFRPEPDTDNMGWGGGLLNDPFHYSDDINRSLFTLHCVLGPGRFAAETVLDACALLGVAQVSEAPVEEESAAAARWQSVDLPPTASSVGRFGGDDEYGAPVHGSEPERPA